VTAHSASRASDRLPRVRGVPVDVPATLLAKRGVGLSAPITNRTGTPPPTSRTRRVCSVAQITVGRTGRAACSKRMSETLASWRKRSAPAIPGTSFRSPASMLRRAMSVPLRAGCRAAPPLTSVRTLRRIHQSRFPRNPRLLASRGGVASQHESTSRPARRPTACVRNPTEAERSCPIGAARESSHRSCLRK
jgi:hypothetical protein